MVFVTLFFSYLTVTLPLEIMEIVVMCFIIFLCLVMTVVVFLACYTLNLISKEELEQDYDHGSLTQYKDY